MLKQIHLGSSSCQSINLTILIYWVFCTMSIPFLITYDLAMRIRQKKVKSEISFWSLCAKMNQNIKLKYILWAKVGKLILEEKTPNYFTDKSFCPFASSKDLFRNGQNTSPNLIFRNFNLGVSQEHPLGKMYGTCSFII